MEQKTMNTVTLKTLVDAQQSIEDLLESQKNLIFELSKNNKNSVDSRMFFI